MFKKRPRLLAVAAAAVCWLSAAIALRGPASMAAPVGEPPKKEGASAVKAHSHDDAKSDDASEKHEGEKDEGEKEWPQRISHDEEGRTIVTLDAATQARIGLIVEPARQASFAPSQRAFGRLIEDPAASFTLRSPLAGFLRVPSDAVWPAVGSTVAAGASIGVIEPRFSAAERFDLIARAMDARAEVHELQASLRATRASLESKQRLNVGDHVISDRAIEEAEARLKGEEARLEAAIKKAEICEAQADPRGGSVGGMPLMLPTGGEVVEVMAGPGESAESGQPLLRIIDLRRLIARVELPIGERFIDKFKSAQISAPGDSGPPLAAQVLGRAPSVHPDLGGQAFLLSVNVEKTAFRPGMAVVADFIQDGDATPGARIARDAVLHYSGAAWVYVRHSDTEFVRCRINEARAIDSDSLVTDLPEREKIVVKGAGAILSEELKSLAAQEEE